ncbi:nucleoside 2-deoxyribosyltransferase [Bradyrhizobium sp. LVM 105]|uniref:Nucleoside 2-deoxyribosyltransferase n=1 Tax=Bradyrhizobium frederickii TaxID=2560054 RepID=A0A4Y9KVC0_9BRAD|nr:MULTISPECIES: nucleoside 2-deoxyribosyltransferase [Bradyrhizobium]RTE90981.1 nucleoside 2-deoxyribosyltransferase [Bradyrhizobium sp. LVM 105]TFV35270.1 nucleoside 2-deoxyribosyltransferase [Bradyrhizobium frederickii]TFV69523.1 nucleoside 2-deoxyribosyltransferase [Bradyrhizobium frederickii]
MPSPCVYLAAPLFNPRERAFNDRLTRELEQRNVKVFLPQRDGTLLVDMLEAGVSQIVAERRVFAQDIDALRSSDALVAVLDGATIDEGVAFEVGFAYALGLTCVAIQTDVRRALPTGNNPMISQSFREIFTSEDELLHWVDTYSLDWQAARATA